MSAVVKIEPHECVSGFEHGQQHSRIGLCAGVGLYIGKLCTEKLFHALAGQVFHLVYHTATTVIAFAGQSFGILVCQVGTHGLHDLFADKILGGYQFHTFQLALMFFLDKVENLLISVHFAVIF